MIVLLDLIRRLTKKVGTLDISEYELHEINNGNPLRGDQLASTIDAKSLVYMRKNVDSKIFHSVSEATRKSILVRFFSFYLIY